jgi:hypothetical protein
MAPVAGSGISEIERERPPRLFESWSEDPKVNAEVYARPESFALAL